MSVHSIIETEEDLIIIKKHTLLPILLEMLARDINELKMYRNKMIYNHILFYLNEIEQSIYLELQSIKKKMRERNIKALNTEMNARGVHVEYKVRGYTHHFTMLRSLVKAELMTMLMNMRRRLE
ncbi:hypothetical protein [Paenibacillus sp. KS-LC4]|uniref:hypothetical protein n=1 Tax=Paenibacillus sp. KS-LC4 TaxID=2979727 RepID=UPI0030CF9CE7